MRELWGIYTYTLTHMKNGEKSQKIVTCDFPLKWESDWAKVDVAATAVRA